MHIGTSRPGLLLLHVRVRSHYLNPEFSSPLPLLDPSTALPFILGVVSRRHTTLCTTLDMIGLGVGWRDCIVVLHLSLSLVMVIASFHSYCIFCTLVFPPILFVPTRRVPLPFHIS